MDKWGRSLQVEAGRTSNRRSPRPNSSRCCAGRACSCSATTSASATSDSRPQTCPTSMTCCCAAIRPTDPRGQLRSRCATTQPSRAVTTTSSRFSPPFRTRSTRTVKPAAMATGGSLWSWLDRTPVRGNLPSSPTSPASARRLMRRRSRRRSRVPITNSGSGSRGSAKPSTRRSAPASSPARPAPQAPPNEPNFAMACSRHYVCFSRTSKTTPQPTAATPSSSSPNSPQPRPRHPPHGTD